MSQLPNVPLPIGQIYATSIYLWRTCIFKKTQLLALLMMVWGIFPFFFVPAFSFHDLYLWFRGIFVYYGLPFIFYFLGFLSLFAAVYYCAGKALVNQEAGCAVTAGIKKLVFLIPAVVISGLVLSLGYIAFVIPGIILQPIMMFYYPLIIVDDIGPLVAFKRSFQLVDNYWWRTIFIIGIPLVLFASIILGIDKITYLLMMKYEPDRPFWIIDYIFRMLLGALAFPFFATLILVQINDLKLRRQAHGQS